MKKTVKKKHRKALKKFRRNASKETPPSMYWHQEDPSDGQWWHGYNEDGHPCIFVE